MKNHQFELKFSHYFDQLHETLSKLVFMTIFLSYLKGFLFLDTFSNLYFWLMLYVHESWYQDHTCRIWWFKCHCLLNSWFSFLSQIQWKKNVWWTKVSLKKQTNKQKENKTKIKQKEKQTKKQRNKTKINKQPTKQINKNKKQNKKKMQSPFKPLHGWTQQRHPSIFKC